MAELPAFLQRARAAQAAMSAGGGNVPQASQPAIHPSFKPVSRAPIPTANNAVANRYASQQGNTAPSSQGFGEGASQRQPPRYTSSSAFSGPAIAESPVDTSAEQTIREVFLSPKIIDREAFSDYAGQLKQLIETSSGQAEALKSAAIAAQSAQQQMQQAATASQPKIEAAAKVLIAFDGKVRTAEEVISRAELLGRELLSRHDQATLALDAKITELAHKAELAARLAEERAATAEASAQMKIAELQARLEAVSASVDQQLDSKLADLERRTRAAADDAVALADTANTRILETQQIVQHACHDIETRGAKTLGRFKGDLDTSASHLSSLIAEAKIILNPNPVADNTGRFNIAALAQLVTRAEQIGDDASFATRQLESVRDQADMARSLLGESVSNAAHSIDTLRSASDQLKAALTSSLSRVAEAEGSIRSKADELTAALRIPVVEAESMADEIRINVAKSIEQVTAAQTSAARVSAETTAVMTKLTHLVDDLQPWHGLLVDHTPGTMPEPIENIVRQFKGELVRDLSHIAAGMHQITTKAVQLAETLRPQP